MSDSAFKTRLDNGLTVVLKEMHHAPVASFWIWYSIGSRNEKPGYTGIAHWVEHMMFKGTAQFPAGQLDRMVSREGGRWNAFTWIDFTAYFETMPADRIELAVRLEADRMVNTIMTPEEADSERTVIISERHMYENQPMFLLSEEVTAAAFRVHPYHHEVIGDEVDLETMTRADLHDFYRRHYAPNNATVVAVGDFETGAMLGLIERYFGRIPAADTPAPITRREPPQRGQRAVTLKGPGDTSYILYGYKAPAASDPDYYPMALLNAAFSGGGSLGWLHETTTNHSSRLYKALVLKELAAGVSSGMTPTIDPYLYTIMAVVRPDRQPAEVEAALDAEIARLATDPITADELAKALKRTRVQLALASESNTGQAQMLGFSEAVAGDYRWFEQTIARLEAVTLDDIERVRARYLDPDNRTIGRYMPSAGGDEVGELVDEDGELVYGE